MHFERLTPALGANVHGFDPAALDDDSSFDKLHAALMEHQVLFIDRLGLDPHDLAALGAGLGPVANNHHSYTSHPDNDDVVVLSWGGDDKPDAAEWHADGTYMRRGPFASLLQAVELPPLGGDTLWASMSAVHDALPPGLRDDLTELQAHHDMGGQFRTAAYRKGGDEGIQQEMIAAGSQVHPMIDHHPVTGRPFLNVSESFTRFIIGLSAAESARILTMLFDLINRPDFHVRLRWAPGTLAIWDNRGTQHYACADYLPHRRVMWRVGVLSDARTAA